MKRTLGLIAASAAVAVLTLTGCSSNDTNNDTTPNSTTAAAPEGPGPLRSTVDDFVKTRNAATQIEGVTAAQSKFGTPECAAMLNGMLTGLAGKTGPMKGGNMTTTIKDVTETGTTGTSKLQDDPQSTPYTLKWSVIDGSWKYNCDGVFDQ